MRTVRGGFDDAHVEIAVGPQHLADRKTERVEELGQRRYGNGLGDGKVERDAGRARVVGPKLAAARVEADRLVGSDASGLEQHVRTRKGGVPAQVDLDLGGEPPEVESSVRARAHECGLGVPHLGGDPLHPCVVAVAEHDCRRVPPERLGRERVDDEDRQASFPHATTPEPYRDPIYLPTVVRDIRPQGAISRATVVQGSGVRR